MPFRFLHIFSISDHLVKKCHTYSDIEKPFFTFVGEKCSNTTILDPQQLKIVAVGLTFWPFVGVTFTSFVGPTLFVSQQMKTVGVGGNYAPFVIALLLFLEIFALKSVGGTLSLLLDQQFQSLTSLYFVGPTVLSPPRLLGILLPFWWTYNFWPWRLLELLSPQQSWGPKTVGTTKYRKVAPTVLRARNCRSNERGKVSPTVIGA